jgi:adenylate cyclase
MRTYADTQKTVKQIAAELGASHLLAGAVRRAGEKVRLTLQLIDPATDSNVWSRTFDRQLSDALSLQSEVAKEVATALDVKLIPDDDRAKDGGQTPPTATNPIAYDLYLKGKLQLARISHG